MSRWKVGYNRFLRCRSYETNVSTVMINNSTNIKKEQLPPIFSLNTKRDHNMWHGVLTWKSHTYVAGLNMLIVSKNYALWK